MIRHILNLAGLGLRDLTRGANGWVLGVGAAVLLSLVLADRAATRQELTCKAAELQSQIDTLSAQVIAANVARDAAIKQAERDAQISEQWKEEADAFKVELQTRSDRPVLSPADAQRLWRLGR